MGEYTGGEGREHFYLFVHPPFPPTAGHRPEPELTAGNAIRVSHGCGRKPTTLSLGLFISRVWMRVSFETGTTVQIVYVKAL